jgi:hypothetical protein
MDMGAAFPSLLDRLVASLEAARLALGSGQAGEGLRVLGDAFALLGALYATLDSGRHPELSDYLQSVYDRCLQSIGEAGPGRCDGLSVPIVLLQQIGIAERRAQERPGRWSEQPRGA